MHHNKVIIRTTIFNVCPERSLVSPDVLQGVSGQNNFFKAAISFGVYSTHTTDGFSVLL